MGATNSNVYRRWVLRLVEMERVGATISKGGVLRLAKGGAANSRALTRSPSSEGTPDAPENDSANENDNTQRILLGNPMLTYRGSKL
jgi:hypothetical protein